MLHRRFFLSILLLCAPQFVWEASGQVQASIKLHVDLTDAPRNIYHVQLALPTKPGPLTLVYPKWIPGNHRPSGPIANVTGLHFQAGGREVQWQRDDFDMHAFHVEVPTGATELKVSLDTLTGSDSAGGGGAAASSNLLDLNWNQVVLYPKDMSSDAVSVSASAQLPAGWQFGTALPVVSRNGDSVAFQTVSLTTLVDSPLIAGSHYRKVELTSDAPVHVIDMVAESEADLEMSPQDLVAYRKLVGEANALFGAHHYKQYHFLYTLSDEVGHHGLEHHESSDNSVGERTLIDADSHMTDASLLPHEYVHSWNGKYRRPAGLATKNYQDPMVGDLLWVYEGLTEYLGDVLTARSGLWTPDQYRDALAETAAMLDHRAGRTWRPLEDTARSVQTLRLLGSRWVSWRRSLDYYPEGELIWLEVDATIRQQTNGRKSLDDFCKLFHGGQSTPPIVVSYTFDDIVRMLSQVTPYDWGKLLKERVKSTAEHAPLGGIEHGGWKLVYNDQENRFEAANERLGKYLSVNYSLGFTVDSGGVLEDVIPGSPAYQAGLGPGMKILAVNTRKFSKDVLLDAIRSSRKTIDLLAENAQFVKAYSIPYHEGLKNPHLERADGADILDDILKPLTK